MLSCFGANFSLAEDATLEKGYLSRQHPKAGILVHLHGCDGLVLNHRIKSWMSYFEKLGYKIIAPNSFADERPPASCKRPFPAKDIIYSVRIAQTNRALEQVRQQYPGFRIYVWGHSEGAGVANLIDEKIDGIITTGYQCGFRTTASSRIRSDVPLLALMDDKDGYIAGVLDFISFKSIDALCTAMYAGKENRTWHNLVGAGHVMSISDNRVTPIVDKFFAVKK
jgi:dienelactone hydrolase